MTDSHDDRSPLAVAMTWVSQITTISMEMALPPLLGHWADRWLGTGIVFVLLGVILGFGTGMWHLIRLAGTQQKRRPSDRSPDE